MIELVFNVPDYLMSSAIATEEAHWVGAGAARPRRQCQAWFRVPDAEPGIWQR